MAVKQIITEELYTDPFDLIAIHSDLEDYTLAYRLNFALEMKLGRVSDDLALIRDSKKLFFSVFEWDDERNATKWTLFSNQCQYEQKETEAIGLFAPDIVVKKYALIDEKSEVDYVLKAELNYGSSVDSYVKTIMSLPGVQLAYGLDVNQLKSKDYLIE